MKTNHFPSFIILTMIALILNCSCISYAKVAYADEFSQHVKNFITEMADSIAWRENQQLRIGIGNFNYLESRMASPFAAYLMDEIDAALVADKRFKVIVRKELDEILKEHELPITDIIDPETAARIGNIEGIDAILHGSYEEWGDGVRISAKIILIQGGEKLASNTKRIKNIPENVLIKPTNYNAMKVQIQKLSEWLPQRLKPFIPHLNSAFQKNSDFDIRAWVNRGPGGIYRKGEEMTVYLKSELDCYVEIYDIYPNGETRLIFPNEFWQDNFIRRNKLYELPRKTDPYNFEITPPFGIESLKVLASTAPLPNVGTLNNPQTIRKLKARAKDVAVKPTAKLAQYLCVFTTME